jgi:cytoskeletal protein RodZ
MLSVAEILRKGREEKNLTLKEVEKVLRIRVKHLQAVESGDWSKFSSEIYIAGIIKNYATFLNLDEGKLLAFFRREYEEEEYVKFKRRVSNKYLTPETKKIATAGLVIIFLLFIGYFSFQLKLYFSPPLLNLQEPKQSVFKRVDKVRVVGQTEKEATIKIFGDRIYQDQQGIFRYDFPLKLGRNILTIEVVGANGKKTTLEKEFILER